MSLGKFLIMKMTTFQFTKQKNSPCFTEPVVFLYGCVCPVLCQLCFSPSSKWRTFLCVPRCYYCCLIFHSITYAHPVVFLASLVAQLVKSSPAVLETRVQSLGREDRREKGMHPSPVFLPGESHGQRSLSGYSPQVCKELNTTEATWHGMATLKTCFFRTRNIFYLTVLLGEDSELTIAGYQWLRVSLSPGCN